MPAQRGLLEQLMVGVAAVVVKMFASTPREEELDSVQELGK
jgi:hypothetical protein